MTYETLQEAIGRVTIFEIVKIKPYTYKGHERKDIYIKKLRSGNTFFVVQYENGRFSGAC